jgi:homoserine O-acetyltransferase
MNFVHPPMQNGWIAAPHRSLDLGDFSLESGERILDCRLSWVMHGSLSPARNNAVLAVSAIGTTHHRLDFLIGPDRALDTNRFCVICVDALGNGLSSSPSNNEKQPYEKFPRFGIRDMVESQRRLMLHLGIDRWRAVIGASMGGMQALQWGVSYPNAMDTIVAMTPMARTAAWSAAINAAVRGALMADPDWARPSHHSRGFSAWVPMMQLISGRTPAALSEEFENGNAVREWIEKRQVEQPLHGVVAIDWIWQSHAYDAHDVGTTPGFNGDTKAALAGIKARTLVLAPPLDLYNPAEAARVAAAGIPGARFEEIPSNRGHQSASAARIENGEWLNDKIRMFL